MKFENKKVSLFLKNVFILFTFLNLKSAGRPECMGHNTCKSMGWVLCVVRRQIAIKFTEGCYF